MSYEHHSAEKTQIGLSYLQLCKAKSWTFKNKNSYWGFNCLRLECLLEFLNCILILVELISFIFCRFELLDRLCFGVEK